MIWLINDPLIRVLFFGRNVSPFKFPWYQGLECNSLQGWRGFVCPIFVDDPKKTLWWWCMMIYTGWFKWIWRWKKFIHFCPTESTHLGIACAMLRKCSKTIIPNGGLKWWFTMVESINKITKKNKFKSFIWNHRYSRSNVLFFFSCFFRSHLEIGPLPTEIVGIDILQVQVEMLTFGQKNSWSLNMVQLKINPWKKTFPTWKPSFVLGSMLNFQGL